MKSSLRIFGAGLILTLLLALSGLLVGCSKAGRAARHFERAEAYLRAGEREKAEIEYLNVLRLEPLNARAIERLGEVYFEQGRFPRALVFLLKTRELDTNNIIARLHAAQSFMAVGQPKSARDEVLPVLELQPTNETALLLLVESPRNTNELAEVEQRLAQLRPRLENHTGLFLAQAALAMMRRDSNTAARASLEAVQRGPQSHVAHLVRGGFLLTLNDLTNALRHFETAAQLAPVRSLVPVRYAELCLQLGERARGRAVLSNLLTQASDYLPAQVQMLKLELAEGRLDECEALIRRVLASENTHFDALVARGQILLARGKREAALKELERVVGVYPKSAPAQYAYALTLLINGDETKAASALNQALSLEPNYPDALLLRARLDMRRGDTAAAVTALTELLRQRPRLVPARMALAEAYGLRGALPEALAIYQGLAKEFPQDPQFPFLIGLILRDQQKLDEAYRSFEQALALAPGNFQALRQLVELRLLRQEYDAARQLLAEPLAKTPPTAAPLVLLALTYLAQNDLARAEEILLKAIAVEPDARPAYLMLAQVLVAGGKQQQALERLEGLLAKNPKDLGALLQVAMLRESLDQPEQAAEAYRKLLEINPKLHPALNNLAYLYCDRLGRLDEALELAKQARELACLLPQAIHLSAAMCAQHRGQVIDGIKRRLQDGEPTLVVWSQLVECGVDFSFPVVYRALAGLDSIAQAAGRCNRHGAESPGTVVIFRVADERSEYPPDYRYPVGITQTLLKQLNITQDAQDSGILYDPSTMSTYFASLYKTIGRDESENYPSDEQALWRAIDAGRFDEVERLYRLIPDVTINVVTTYNPEETEKLAAELDRATDRKGDWIRDWIRRASPYAVSMFRPPQGSGLANHLQPIAFFPRASAASEESTWFMALPGLPYDDLLGLVASEESNDWLI